MTFADLGLSDELLRAVDDSGYDEPTPIQRAAIPSVLMGKDLIGIAQTGTGKTAGFVLPMIDILHHGRSRARMPRSLILEPTRELAMQVAENFEKYGKYHPLSMALLIGGVQMGDQVKALEKGVDVLIATPGRLMDLFGRGKIMLNDCNLLVIDEADRMLDMGFIPDIEEICSKLPKNAPDPAVLGDHAAADPEARRTSSSTTPSGSRSRGRRPPTSISSSGWSRSAPTRRRTRCATSCATRNSRTRSSSRNRKTTVRELATSLKRSGFSVGQIQGDMDQSDRIAEFDRFKKDEINILVASDVAARGLDVKGVSHVINFDVPWQPDDYIHRIGRTGRAGHDGHRHHACDARGCARRSTAIEKLTGHKIARVGAAEASDAGRSAERRSPRSRKAAERRSRAEAQADAEPKAERARRSKPERAEQRKPNRRSAKPPAERSPVVEDIKSDWNGPLPSFLSVSAG